MLQKSTYTCRDVVNTAALVGDNQEHGGQFVGKDNTAYNTEMGMICIYLSGATFKFRDRGYLLLTAFNSR